MMIGMLYAFLAAALAFAADVNPPAPGPYRQPALASDGAKVALTFGADTTIYFSLSKDGGKQFDPPVTVAQVAKLGLGRHRGPRVALTGSGAVIAAPVTVAGGNHMSPTDLQLYRSTDGGRTWQQGPMLNDTPGTAGEGFVSLASDGQNKVWAVWLDNRGKRMRLYGASSNDAGATWAANRVIYESPDGNICECCHPTVTLGPKGEVYIMWRNSLAGSRDLYLATSTDGASFRTEKLGQGTWPLKACPMDGGGLAIVTNTVTTVWRREKEIYLAQPGKPEQSLGEGKDPSIAAGPKGIYLAWTVGDQIVVQKPGDKQAAPLAKGAYVSLSGGRQVIAAFEQDGRIEVRRLDQ
jgi:hypothetical protein